MAVKPAHQTFPLTSTALSRLSLTPEFDYLDAYSARQLSARLQPAFQPYSPAEIRAVGLMGRIFLYVFKQHIQSSCPNAFSDLDSSFIDHLGINQANNTLQYILEQFPTSSSFYQPETTKSYNLTTGSTITRHGLYLSVFLVILANQNPAIENRDQVFSSPQVRHSDKINRLFKLIQNYFVSQPSVGATGKDIFEFLAEPARAHPDSLSAQLEYIRQHWSDLLGEELLQAILLTLDSIKEEMVFQFSGRPLPENPLLVAKASYLTEDDVIRFSDDLDWMPKLILLAKNIYVWLDQLSKQYQRSIFHLSHIPDQELEKLSSWGINGLWMIGLWERSPASQRIKQICGNIDAVPSAYSLFDYQIAETLGGEEAYHDLMRRAAAFNIRLAADMVPNHMGVYSKWIIEHPEWFLSLDRAPFPGYSFHGENLSSDPRISVQIEDHYYDKSDAAVTFKHVDHRTGIERHIYHGNDGTAMPWNDTAQIDFLNPQAREAVIDAILHVARKFPIIRFDAAMTLAKKHIQRLWYPEPGSGGAIPTRSDHSMSKVKFDQLMPEEFWREVVDRVAIEAPDTLLLAEAFWMMEGFFVRSLGMHRVYNSAFMHMLRDEKNLEYRNLIIETLEYDPQILKRYVNFMNNPDEDTAIQQFGSDGKYFGVCVLMATLPGLPMLGHGQIEGFSEKYGMEYRRAYYQEQPDQHLIERHQREIFPLFQKRHLFADVENFFPFDFITENGSLNTDVFAFSNRSGEERALVIYHNKWGDTKGTVAQSTSINGSSTPIMEALGLSDDESAYILYRDSITGLEYLISSAQFRDNGLQLELGAYQYHVFLDFHLVLDSDGVYHQLANQLSGQGVPSISHALNKIKYTPLLDQIQIITDHFFSLSDGDFDDIEGISAQIQTLSNRADLHHRLQFSNYNIETAKRLYDLRLPSSVLSDLRLSVLLNWLLIHNGEDDNVDEHDLIPMLASRIASDNNSSPFSIKIIQDSFNVLPRLLDSLIGLETLYGLPELWFQENILRDFLQMNIHEGISWFNQEAIETLLDLTLGLLAVFPELMSIESSFSHEELKKLQRSVLSAIEASNYQEEAFIEAYNALSNGTIRRSEQNR